jgi:hypothetical protein
MNISNAYRSLASLELFVNSSFDALELSLAGRGALTVPLEAIIQYLNLLF